MFRSTESDQKPLSATTADLPLFDRGARSLRNVVSRLAETVPVEEAEQDSYPGQDLFNPSHCVEPAKK